MSPDDVLAYLARMPKCNRPVEMRGDKQMLAAWQRLRNDPVFSDHVLWRHNLHDKSIEDFANNENALGNAWGLCVESIVIQGS